MAKNGLQWRNRIVNTAMVPCGQLLANEANWRIHPKPQQSALTGILNEVGWVQQVIVNKRTSPEWQANRNIETMVDGHLRVSLALSKGEEVEVPVVFVDLTPNEEALVLATFDPLSAMAAADKAQLDALLRDVNSGDAAVQAMLAELAKESGLDYGKEKPEAPEAQIDRAAELQEKWQTSLGQLWEAGKHKLICGDCTDNATVDRLMAGEKVSLVVTDPPYGVEYADKNKFLNAISRGNRIQTPIENDHGDKADIQEMWKKAFHETEGVMLPGAVIYCFMPQGGDQMMMMMMMMMMGAGIEPRHELIWLKNNHVLGRVDYAYKHEPILYAWKAGGHKFYGDFQTSILEFPKPQKSDLHPTTKPVELIGRLISNSSQKGERVYDPFLGSGTSIIACETLERVGCGCELDPAYAAVALERLSDMGLTPRLVSA